MHSVQSAREIVDFLCLETPDFIPPYLWHLRSEPSQLQELGYHATSCLPDKSL